MPAAGDNADALRIAVSAVEVRHLTAIGAVPGVVLGLAAARNGPGTGRLRYTSAGLAWRAPGSSRWGAAVDVSAGGEFLLEDGGDRDKWVRATVHASHLVLSAEAEVHLADRYGAWLDDVAAAEAAAGDVEIQTLMLSNAGDATLGNVHAWLAAGTSDLELSGDLANWYTATVEADGVSLGDLAPAASVPLYVRRTIAAGAAADPKVLALVRLGFRRPLE